MASPDGHSKRFRHNFNSSLSSKDVGHLVGGGGRSSGMGGVGSEGINESSEHGDSNRKPSNIMTRSLSK